MTDGATYHPETETFTLKSGAWSNTYPILDLPKWLSFYRRMKADFPKSGNSYDWAIEALEKLAKEAGVGAA